MNRQQEIAQAMQAVRASGTATANRLPAAIDRAQDWREYVRAYPMQSVVAAALLGFALIPSNSKDQGGHSVSAQGQQPVRGKSRRGLFAAIADPLKPWAISAATELAKRMVMQQMAVISNNKPTQTNNHDRRTNAFQDSRPGTAPDERRHVRGTEGLGAGN
jgi:hypothetical protein